MKTRKYKITGMFCAACVSRVEKALSKVEGVDSYSVNLISNDAEVSFNDEVHDDEVIKAVSAAGYGISIDFGESVSQKQSARKKALKKELIRLIAGVILSLLVMYFSMAEMMNMPSINPIVDQSIALGLTIVTLGLYYDYLYHGLKALFKLSPDMLTLVALGSLISLGYSLYLFALICQGGHHIHTYFDSAAMIPVFVSIGKYLEALAKAQSVSSLEALLPLMPEKALLVDEEEEREIEAKDLKEGDICKVKPGGKVPADGVIIEGYANLEEAALTGEAAPVYRSLGGEVKGGSMNLTGSFKMKVTAVGENTTLNQIAKMVERAAGSKGQLAALADLVSRYFIPSIIVIAIFVFVSWFIATQDVDLSIRFAVTSLVVACPCALGLATPVAVTVGASRSSGMGILFKEAKSFETLAKADYLVIDKTGTITDGHLSVILDKRFKEDSLVADVVYSSEKNSEHPLAWSLALYLEKQGAHKIEVSNFESLHGYGVKARVKGYDVAIGNWALMEKIGLVEKDRIALNEEEKGLLITYVSFNNEIVAYFGAIDALKENSKEVIDELHKHGIKLYLASGDTQIRCEELAKTLGLSHFKGGVSPLGKQEIVESLKKEGHVVAMLGDGVNDAPAIKASDVGMGIGSGSDLALSSADVILRDGSLESLLKAFLLAKKVRINILMNLFWAFIYNLLLIPIAAGALHYVGFEFSPMWASLAMALSSLFVVLNALRLKIVRLH